MGGASGGDASSLSMKELQQQDVLRAAEACPDKRMKEAFMRPAIKTPPANFPSVQAAEAAGWSFNATLGRWSIPKERLASLRAVEKRAKSMTADGAVDAMSVHELQDVLAEFSALVLSLARPEAEGLARADNTQATATGKSSSDGSISSEALRALRQNVKESAAQVQHTLHRAIKDDTFEALARGGERSVSYLPVRVCHACGKPPPAGGTFNQCSGCKSTRYCSRACQVGDWRTHKATCKQLSQQTKEAVDQGADPSKRNEILAWYRSVPNLAESVITMAWAYRNESPYINVQGGVNARLAQIKVCVRREWEVDDVFGFATRFAQHDFQKNTHYFVIIAPGHLGTEQWGMRILRMIFPRPPKEMDAWAAAAEATMIAAAAAAGTFP